MNRPHDPVPETLLAELEPKEAPETHHDAEARFASLISPLPDGWVFSFKPSHDADDLLVFEQSPGPGRYWYTWHDCVAATFMQPGYDSYWNERIERMESGLRLLRHLRAIANANTPGAAS